MDDVDTSDELVGLNGGEEGKEASSTEPEQNKNAVERGADPKFMHEVKTGHERTVKSLAWSPDGSKIATVSMDGYVRCFEVGKTVEPLFVDNCSNKEWFGNVAWSPDGGNIIVPGDNTRCTVQSDSRGSILSPLRLDSSSASSPSPPYKLPHSRDGTRRFAEQETASTRRFVELETESSQSEFTVKLLDAGTGKVMQTIQTGHKGVITSVACSEMVTGDSQQWFLATGSRDKTTRIFELGTGPANELDRCRSEHHKGCVYCVKFRWCVCMCMCVRESVLSCRLDPDPHP